MGKGTSGGGKGGGGGGGAAAAGTKAPESAKAQGGGAPTPSNPAPATPTGIVAAVEASPGARDNFVTLADMRDRIKGTRAEQDAALRQAIIDRKVTLNTHEGLHDNKLTPRERAAAVYQTPDPNGSFTGHDGRQYVTRFIYVSKRQ